MIELSEDAKRRVESARAKAEKKYWRNREGFDGSGLSGPAWRRQVEPLAVDFVEVVLYAHVSEFIQSGASPTEIRVSVESTLAALVDELVVSDKWPMLPKTQLPGIQVSPDDIATAKKLQVISEIKRQPGWRKVQSTLIARSALSSQTSAGTTKSTARNRRAAVDAYIDEVKKTGKKITRTDIWKSAGDKTRAEFERWESCWYERHGRKPNRSADQRFNRVLADKPHLIK